MNIRQSQPRIRRTGIVPILLSLLLLMPALLLLPALSPRAAEAPEAQLPIPTRGDPNQRVCKKVRTTRSYIPKRICLTRQQWLQLEEQGQRTVQQWRDAGEQNLPSPQ
jgi:hypothetical protein